MRKTLTVAIVIFICSCGSNSKQVVDWKSAAFQQLENYKVNFLTGKEDVSEPHFDKAKKVIAGGNDLNFLARIYLNKYALHTAALEDFDDSEFIRINKLQPVASNFAYYNLLKGNFTAVEDNFLPSQYSSFIKLARNKDLAKTLQEIPSIDDPLSRLIACGIWLKYLPYDENILQTAINTAADNGWKRPLWAYLIKLQKYYLDRGETAKTESIKKRLELLKK
jgi:hypothetical protein